MTQPIVDTFESYFNQALASEKGIAVELDSPGQALHFIQKMNQFRASHRKQAKKVYPLDHPMHNKTVWDVLSLARSAENQAIVHIKRSSIAVKGVSQL